MHTSHVWPTVHSFLMLLKTTRSISFEDEMTLPRASSPKQRALSAIDALRTTVSLGVTEARLRLAQVISPAPAGPASVWDVFEDESDY